MAKGVAHAGKGKSLSTGNAIENERLEWDEKSYRRKNVNPINNYDWSRHGLNFEVVRGEIKPLGSQEIHLYDRYKNVLKNLDFKEYKAGASNQQNTYVELILSGSTELMQKLAFGDQQVNYERNPETWHNWNVTRREAIEKWAIDSYNFVCEMYGKDNVVGFEVHLDETAPHAHVNIVPVALMKQRGNVGGYVKIDADGNDVRYTKGKHVGELVKLSQGKYEALSDEKKKQYRPAVRSLVRTISFASFFGSTTKERSEKMSELHDKYFEKVGSKWGLDRGDVWKLLDEEERRKRKRHTKQQAHDLKVAEEEKKRIIDETRIAENDLKAAKANLEEWSALKIDEITVEYSGLQDLILGDDTFEGLLSKTMDDLVVIATTPKPMFTSEKEWKKQQEEKIKEVITSLESKLFGRNGVGYAQKVAINQLCQNLYTEAKGKVAGTIIENDELKKKVEKLENNNTELNTQLTTTKREKNRLNEELSEEQAITGILTNKLQKSNFAVNENGGFITWNSGSKKGQRLTNQEYIKWLKDQFDAKKKELENEKRERLEEREKLKIERAKEKEEMINERNTHRRHIKEFRELLIALLHLDLKKIIGIIIKHWKAELKEFARDAMNDIKDILFEGNPEIDERKLYVSDAFVWAKIFASLDEDRTWQRDDSILKSLKVDAMRIADGTWRAYHERPVLLAAAADTVVKVFNEPRWRQFTEQEAKVIESFIHCDGGDRDELFNEVWNKAKPRLNCDLNTARVIFNEMKIGLYTMANGEGLNMS